LSQLFLTCHHETARRETVLAEATILISRSVRATITCRAGASATARSQIQAEGDQGTWHGRAGSSIGDVGRVVMVVGHVAVVPDASTAPPFVRLDPQVGARALGQEQP